MLIENANFEIMTQNYAANSSSIKVTQIARNTEKSNFLNFKNKKINIRIVGK